MIIENIIIKNFGILKDVVLEFEDDKKMLVFVNGLNGRGKTTLQEALNWCFYAVEPKDNRLVSKAKLAETNNGSDFNVEVSVRLFDSEKNNRISKKKFIFWSENI